MATASEPGDIDIDVNEQQEVEVIKENGIVNKIIPKTYRKHKRIQRHRKLISRTLIEEKQDNELYMQIYDHQRHYLDNSVHTTKYTILSFLPKNLFEQFHRFANVYFVFIVLLNFIPQISAIQPMLSMIPVIGILLVQAIKDIVEDYGRYKSDKEVNLAKSNVFKRDDNMYHTQKWKDLQVGDIVRLYCNDVIPADILLLNTASDEGDCFIETMNIDGETNLKQRSIVKGLPKEFVAKDFSSVIQCERPNSEIYKFHGNITHPNGTKNAIGKENLLLRGCVIRNSDFVDGIVVYAGHETKAMLNNNGPRYKRSKLEIFMNKDVIWCVVLLIILCLIGAVGNSIWRQNMSKIDQTILFIPPDANGDDISPALSGFYMFWTMVILLQVLIPISLYVSIELVKMGQVFFIHRDMDMYNEEADKRLQCRALNITEDLGQVQYVFSDKTGTLTENSMVFHRCTVGGVDYPHAANAARIENQEPSPTYLNPKLKEEKPAEIYHEELVEDVTDANVRQKVLSRNRPQSAITRGSEKRQSYRRPQTSTIRAHHRRNPSVMSAQFTMDGDVPEPSTPQLRRNQMPRKSSRRPPHKHHRRNISTVSAKGALASLAPEDREVILTANAQQQKEDDLLADLESDVTPDPVLYQQLVNSSGHPIHLKVPNDGRRILDFFINLAICNTVVLSKDNPAPGIRLKPQEQVSVKSEQRTTFLPSVPSLGKLFKKTNTTPTTEKFKSLYEEEEPLNTVTDGRLDANNSNGKISIPISPDKEIVFSKKYLNEIRYEAESPDEAALVYAANAYGVRLAHRGNQTVTVTLPQTEKIITYDVLHTLPFDSTRKRMSVVVREPHTNNIILFCKGADSAILDILRDHKKDFPNDDTDSGMGSDYSSSTTSSHQESNRPTAVKDTKKYLNNYAKSGLRTLCIAKRVLTQEEYAHWLRQHEKAEQSIDRREEKLQESFISLERELELLGATGIEDRLQDGVPETIESLRNAGIQVWVITGDKQETAVNISYSCKLINPNDEVIYLNASSEEEFATTLDHHLNHQERVRGVLEEIPEPNQSFLSRLRSNTQTSISQSQGGDGEHKPLGLVVDGTTLEYALTPKYEKKFVELARRCRSVLCCRATPLQKGNVVKLIRDSLHVMTLAIGDGANDVSMIQVANIGIGISGREGMQAVMSSDFAMARFRYLQKLLLVHGHWCYQRLAAMVLYFFYKNAAFIFLIFWYQFFCGFSGSNPIEQWYLILFSLIFTSVPPLVNGVLDQDIPSSILMRKPWLYRQGINSEMYTGRSFWLNIIDACYQSFAMFFIPYATYLDSDVGVIEWGTPVTTACLFCVLVQLGIETKSWTWIHWAWQIFSIVSFFAFSLIYNVICPTCGPPSNPYYMTEQLVQTSNFWFSTILATIVALLPRMLIRTIQSHYWPTESQKERIYYKTNKEQRNVTVNGTAETSAASSTTHHNYAYDANIPNNATSNNNASAYENLGFTNSEQEVSNGMSINVETNNYPIRNDDEDHVYAYIQTETNQRAPKEENKPTVIQGLLAGASSSDVGGEVVQTLSPEEDEVSDEDDKIFVSEKSPMTPIEKVNSDSYNVMFDRKTSHAGPSTVA